MEHLVVYSACKNACAPTRISQATAQAVNVTGDVTRVGAAQLWDAVVNVRRSDGGQRRSTAGVLASW